MKINEKYFIRFISIKWKKINTSMKNLVLSQIDLDIQEVDLKEVKGGQSPEMHHSGSGKDGRTGKMVDEWIIMYPDGSFDHDYFPIP
jgi:hypothetical protein